MLPQGGGQLWKLCHSELLRVHRKRRGGFSRLGRSVLVVVQPVFDSLGCYHGTFLFLCNESGISVQVVKMQAVKIKLQLSVPVQLRRKFMPF